MKKGDEFRNKEAFKRAVAAHVHETLRGCVFPENNREKITAKCKAPSCAYVVRARFNSSGALHVTSSVLEHTCAPGSYPHPHSLLCKEYAETAVRYNKTARPSDVQAVARVDEGALMTYKQAYAALRASVSNGVHEKMTSYGLIAPWLQAMVELNPGTVVDSSVDETGRIQRAFISPSTWHESLAFCLPVVSVDAAHLKCQEGGTLFLASALSPNRDIIVIAAGIAPGEDGATWAWFFECLRQTSCEFDDPDLVFMSDREKGLAGALSTVFPAVPHSFCSFHIKKNVVGGFKTDLNKNIHAIAKCTTSREYEELMSECKAIDAEATEYLRGIPSENWVAHFFPRNRYGQVTTNIAESTNSWVLAERSDSWFGCLSELVRKVQKRAYDKRKAYKSLEDTYVKWVVAKVKKSTREGRTRLVSAVSDTEVEVMRLSGLSYRTVDIALRLCSCGLWTEQGYPCVHGCAALVLLGHNPEDFISERYKVERLQKAFEEYAKPVDYGNIERDGVLPPLIQVKRGRPRKIRIRNRSEFINDDSPVHCSLCHQSGHNKRTCTRRSTRREQRSRGLDTR